MLNKRGQFYLLAAIVLVAVIIGFAAVANYHKKQGPVKVYDLGDELGIEGDSVVEYGIFNEDKLREFTEDFGEYAEGNFYFIYGDKDSLKIATMQDVLIGNINIIIGTTSSSLNVVDKEYTELTTTGIVGDLIEITVEGNKYEFELKPGENFYFVISQNVAGEKHITTNE